MDKFHAVERALDLPRRPRRPTREEALLAAASSCYISDPSMTLTEWLALARQRWAEREPVRWVSPLEFDEGGG